MTRAARDIFLEEVGGSGPGVIPRRRSQRPPREATAPTATVATVDWKKNNLPYCVNAKGCDEQIVGFTKCKGAEV